MTWRKLRVYLEQLPPESATWTALRNATPDDELAEGAAEAQPERGRWSQLEMLVAQLIDAVNHNTDVFVAANSEKGAKLTPTEPVRRPGWKPKGAKRRAAPSSAEAWAHLDAMLAATS